MTEPSLGFRALQVPDEDAAIPCWLVYPARGVVRVQTHGPYTLEAAAGAACVGEGLHLIAISHGNGGSGWTHRTTACALARAGFVVAFFEHPGNSRADDSLAFTNANLVNRPRQLSRVIDAVFADAELGPRLAPEVGAIGQSIGGYTVLAAAGGRPSTLAEHEPDGQPRPLPVIRSPRIRAAALLAPATVWFALEGALADVEIPVFLRWAQLDRFAPELHAQLVLRGLPDRSRVDAARVDGAGHFSFQSPFPASMVRPEFPPSQDPPGFDRAAYLRELDGELIAFFRRTLGAAGGQ